MPRIDLNDVKPEIKTALVAGPSGAGKTFLCASWPRPAWFGAFREGGYETLKYMPTSALYEPDRRPLAYAVKTWVELRKALNDEVWPLVARGEVRTLIVELSFIADDFIAAAKLTSGANNWQPYMDLANAMTFLDTEAKGKGVNVVYNAIDDGHGGILMPGTAVAKRQPAMCDLTGYLHAVAYDRRILEMAPFEENSPRHRFCDRMPPKIVNPTYRKLVGLLAKALVADIDGNVMTPEEAQARGVVLAGTVPSGSGGLPPQIIVPVGQPFVALPPQLAPPVAQAVGPAPAGPRRRPQIV